MYKKSDSEAVILSEAKDPEKTMGFFTEPALSEVEGFRMTSEAKDPMKSFSLKSPALLVIDMQRYFLDPKADAFLEKGPAIIPNVKKLLSIFRKKDLPVIFTRHAHRKGEEAGQMGRWWNDNLQWEGDPQSDLIADLSPRTGEQIVTKTRYSAFERTIVGPYFKGHGIETVVICGVMTHLCVETTARHAFMLDFQPVVVSDACATQTEEHQKASLLNLSHGFAYVLNAQEIISILERKNSKHEIRNPKQIQNSKFK